MNDAIHLVPRIWYRLYYGWMLAFSVLLAVAALVAQAAPQFSQPAAFLGLTTTSVLLAGVHIAYSVSLFWFIRRKSLPLAMVVASMLFSMTLLYGMSHTDPTAGSWVFVAAWLAAAFFIGMYGLTLTLGTVLFAVMYGLLQTEFNITFLSTPGMVLVTMNILLSPVNYLFWRQKFINSQDIKLNRLSGMLRSNQEQSAILIQSIADGVIVVNTEGKITLINPAAASMTQWPVGEALGIDVRLVVKLNKEKGDPIADADNPFALILTRKARISQTLQLVGRGGKKMTISLVISPISVGESNTASRIAGAVAVIRDISAERAEEQQRAEFISTASHEMRTPVAAIEGYLALALNDKVSTVDSRARGFLEKAHASTQHLGKLFQDLLTSAKAEDGRLSSHPQVVEMGAYLQQLIEDLRFSAQKKGLTAEFVVGTSEAIDATAPANADTTNALKIVKPLYYAYIDPDRMREVITNLFDNACKYTDQGKVSIGLTGNNAVIQIYVRDTGPGIPPEDIEHLFQKFYRVDNSATRTVGGTGLGLFISRKIVELYRGRIWVESQLGKGSTFFINLPRLDAGRAQQLQSQQAAEAAAATPVKR